MKYNPFYAVDVPIGGASARIYIKASGAFFLREFIRGLREIDLDDEHLGPQPVPEQFREDIKVYFDLDKAVMEPGFLNSVASMTIRNPDFDRQPGMYENLARHHREKAEFYEEKAAEK